MKSPLDLGDCELGDCDLSDCELSVFDLGDFDLSECELSGCALDDTELADIGLADSEELRIALSAGKIDRARELWVRGSQEFEPESDMGETHWPRLNHRGQCCFHPAVFILLFSSCLVFVLPFELSTLPNGKKQAARSYRFRRS